MATLRQRFMEKIEPVPESGCWLWAGGISSNGYGMIGVGPHSTRTAHRVSWELENGEIPNGMCVLHKCDIRYCVNPSHLYLGTVKQNSADLWKRGNPVANIRGNITSNIENKRIKNLPRGKNHHRSTAKINEDIAMAIFLADGSQREIARKFGVCQQTVSLIKLKKQWRHLHGNS